VTAVLDPRQYQTAPEPVALVPAAGYVLTDAPVRPGGLARRFRRIAGMCGPAFVVSVAYVDPGNFATNISGGARYGYLLLWVIVAANLLAMFVQALSAKLGIATGRDLPTLCRDHLPRPLTWMLWVQGELVAVATDLAEFIGGAIALDLLFGVPLLPAAAITAVVSCGLLSLAPTGRHRFEAVIGGMLVIVLVGFAYQSLRAGSFTGAAGGLVPRLAGGDSLLLATGIIGATVMPHVVYLHSSLTRHQGRNRAAARTALRSSRLDILVALGIAGLVNITMLTVGAAVFAGHDPGGLPGVHTGLAVTLGGGAAFAFALALLASGLASSSVGTYAGQVIMAGFLRRRIPLLARRLLTMAPAFAVLATGLDPTRALILSQVALSFGIPFALIPLIALSSRRKIMGDLVNRGSTIVAGVVVTALITALNGFLVVQACAG
jgi:manganese transport protein